MKARFRLVALIASLCMGLISTGSTVFAASASPQAVNSSTRCCDHRGHWGGWNGRWDHRDHRGWDHREWRGRDWDHRGWNGWGWESQCDWAWYHDRDWYWAYCS
jgi:hypothetical protein